MGPENPKRKAEHYRWLASQISDERSEQTLKEMARELEERVEAEQGKSRKF